MKKLFSKLALVALSISLMSFSCDKDDRLILSENLPKLAQEFIGKHFSNSNIVKTEMERSGGFSVDLSNGVEIDFDASGNWYKVDARDGQSLLALASFTGFIPQNIIGYITSNYPNNPINSIEKTRNGGYEVELVGIKNDIYFDANGQPVGPNAGNNNAGNTPIVPGNTSSPTVQTGAENFLKTYFPSVAVVKVESKTYKTEYDLANGVDVDFDLNGNWIKVDARDGQSLATLATSLGFIPQNILTYLASNYPHNAINGIEKTASGYEVELVGVRNDIYFNASGVPTNATNNNTANNNNVVNNVPSTVVGAVPAAVQTKANSFLNTYFPSVRVVKVEVERNEVEYDLANGVDVDFDINGNWKNVDAPNGQSIPTGFIPVAIVNYVKANYPHSLFNSIERKATSYEVELVGFHRDLIFDLNGNFVGLD